MKAGTAAKDYKDRKVYLDCLRILATFSVMILHISAYKYSSVGVETFEGNVLNFYDGIVRWTVPVFVMISGALFLGGNQELEQIYRKNIFKIVTAFIFWSALYALVYFFTYHCEFKTIIGRFVPGHYHMWFLFMISGLYIIVPFLRKIVSSVELTRYFLVLSLIFTFILPQSVTFISFMSEEFGTAADAILNKVIFHFTLGYVSYFVCGYYLSKTVINGKRKWAVYISGICGFIMTVVFSAMRPDGTFYGNFTINVMLESIVVFVFVKNKLELRNVSYKAKIRLKNLSKYCFGAYMVHAMVIEYLDYLFGFNALSFNPVVAVPVIGVIVFVISFAISGILNHIPVLGEYIV